MSETESYRVLLVEDDAGNLEVTTRLLTRAGFAISCPTSVKETIEMAIAFNPHVILMDLKLNNWTPEADGRELARELRQHQGFQATPIIALTGDGTEDRVNGALAAGCNEVIEKPFEYVELVARLKEVCSK